MNCSKKKNTGITDKNIILVEQIHQEFFLKKENLIHKFSVISLYLNFASFQNIWAIQI